jgi:hypothetical protein
MDNQFTERYAKLSNAELLDVIKRAPQYQPLAVDTAEKEIKSRNLTKEQIVGAEQEWIELKKAKQPKSEKFRFRPSFMVQYTGVLVRWLFKGFQGSFMDVLNQTGNEEKDNVDILSYKITNTVIGMVTILFLFWLISRF